MKADVLVLSYFMLLAIQSTISSLGATLYLLSAQDLQIL